MPYKLKTSETIPQNIRRIVCEEIDFAVQQLKSKNTKKRDEAIHEARKSIKKIRGVLKLLRPELGKVYREQNSRLRDLGAKLSELRDAGVIIETFDSVVNRNTNAATENAFSAIRKALEQNKKDKEQSENIVQVMAGTASELIAVKSPLENWPISDNGFASLCDGLRKTYRLGRSAMHKARNKNRPELFHEWRKRTKDHWYHVRLLESSWTEAMIARERSLHDLETWLGDDHNIVVLLGELNQNPDRYGSAKDLDMFASLAKNRQKELRQQALSLGERLYGQKSKLLTKHFERLWNVWQHQPDEPNEAKPKAPKPASSSTKKTAA